GFDLIVHPTQRGALEYSLLSWLDVVARLQKQAPDAPQAISTDVMDCDATRQDMLRDLGYEAQAPYMCLTTRSLQTPIPESALPEGFRIRPVAGEHEVALLTEVHMSAFNSTWTPDEYLRVMRTPGFDIEHELVVVAPDGRFAAFLIYWPDP